MLQVATTTTCCKSLKEILNTKMILSLQQRTNYINNYFINKNEKDVMYRTPVCTRVPDTKTE